MALTKIPNNLITADAIDGTLIADDAINSEHYTDGSIDTAHIAADQITSALIADDQIDSEHYVDGSIDLAHMSANSIDSDQYVDGSIDNAHLADDAVGVAELSATGTASSSTFLRGDNSWTAVSTPITALNNATANELVTVGSTTTELDAEANLVFDGTNLLVGLSSSIANASLDNLQIGGGSGNVGMSIYSGTSGYGGIAFADGNSGSTTQYPGLIEFYHADNSLRLYTTATERIRITSAGNVGIGTASPDANLSVTDTTVNSKDVLYLKSGADSVGDYLGMAFEIGVGGNGPHGAVRTYGGPSGNDSYMSFLTTTDGGTLVQQMTIDHVGNVGINDTSPSYTLDVDGDINFTGSLREDGEELNLSTLKNYNIDYLVIAGGGQGGDQHGGGAGAGGYRNSYSSETSGRGASSETAFTTGTGVVYTCTVGGGATTSHPGSGQDGANGSNSSLAGSGLTTITCTGGGGGAGHADGGATGNNGGCGGGSGLTGVGGDGVAAQGYDGGDNPGSGYASWPQVGAGGGGAGAAGGDGHANSSGDQNGWGGTGLASSITGSSVVRGGGGGGGSHSPHTPASGANNLGAAGGGGQGGLGNSTSTNATNGTDTKGGGGGGSNGAGQACGGGGDGVVILRMPTSSYSGTTTGSPTVSTSGSSTILTFTGTGTYTS